MRCQSMSQILLNTSDRIGFPASQRTFPGRLFCFSSARPALPRRPAFPGFPGRRPADEGRDHHVFQRIELRQQVVRLEHKADPAVPEGGKLPRPQVQHVRPVIRDLTKDIPRNIF